MKLEFHYQLELEDIQRYRALSIEDRLQWLEEQYLFFQEVLPQRSQQIILAFRKNTDFDKNG